MVSYLKGIHQTLNTWCLGHGIDIWRLTYAKLHGVKISLFSGINLSKNTDASSQVKSASWLEDDISELQPLFQSPYPVSWHIRWTMGSVVLSDVGDAFGVDFGSSIQTNLVLKIRHGIWGFDLKKKTSNYKKLNNIVETIEVDVISVYYLAQNYLFSLIIYSHWELLLLWNIFLLVFVSSSTKITKSWEGGWSKAPCNTCCQYPYDTTGYQWNFSFQHSRRCDY